MLIKQTVLVCNFCGKTQIEVSELVKAENNSAICRECAQTAMEIFAEESAKRTPAASSDESRGE
jgi:ATP-dependent protease Clp ATPase subunit